MSPVRCYAVPGKQRSYDIMQAFGVGCTGILDDSLRYKHGASAFYGVWPKSLALFKEATDVKHGFPWYYVDNSYFDASRGRQWRVTRNRQQVDVKEYFRLNPGDPSRARLEELGIKIAPWRRRGEHILVAHQTPFWYERHGLEGWPRAVEAELRKHTERPIRHRGKPADLAAAEVSLEADLDDCFAVVAHSSAVMLEALLRGIPIFATATDCAARFMSGELARIDDPFYPDNREAFFAALANSQWTLEEIRRGFAWKGVNLV